MKASEFKKQIRELGFSISRVSSAWMIASVNRHGEASINIEGTGYSIANLPADVARVVIEFSNTSIDERDDEKSGTLSLDRMSTRTEN